MLIKQKEMLRVQKKSGIDFGMNRWKRLVMCVDHLNDYQQFGTNNDLYDNAYASLEKTMSCLPKISN